MILSYDASGEGDNMKRDKVVKERKPGKTRIRWLRVFWPKTFENMVQHFLI